jgi:hypothetical protein
MTNDMSGSTPQPPAGWYPDPSGKPGQMYWDGQRWRTETPPPAAAPAPWNMARPPWEIGRSFWSGMSRNAKIVLAAGVGLVVAIVVVLAIGTAASGPSGQPAPTGRTAAPSGGHSPAYNRGYDIGNQHMGPSWASNLVGEYDCQYYAADHDVARRDVDDWVQGCMDGIRDMKAEGH